jgi:hypothetical protein
MRCEGPPQPPLTALWPGMPKTSLNCSSVAGVGALGGRGGVGTRLVSDGAETASSSFKPAKPPRYLL